ncbi:MAG: CoB--CoM heterodisulfide reductase iron-sulfur subunit A family protein [Ignisphaera sp.]
MGRVAVFLCHCGTNIAGVIDIQRVAEEIRKISGVAIVQDSRFLCSTDGIESMVDSIRSSGVDRVVVAACSFRTHEPLFQNALRRAGLNPYLLELVNVRELCSWVHEKEREKATEKAVKMIRAAIAKIQGNQPLERRKLPVIPAALVIGGGIAGIRAALDIADAGFTVYLVEKEPSIGGNMARLDKTFPTLDCSICILGPLMNAVAQHPNIKLLTYSEVLSIEGRVGEFSIKILRKPRYVREDLCKGCLICIAKCPAKADDEFNMGLSHRKAIYIQYPQAVPRIPAIDPSTCFYFQKGICRACEKLCPTGAIDFSQRGEVIEVKVGAIVVATGFEEYTASQIYEYGYGRYPNVITGLQLERLVSSYGPTGGRLTVPRIDREPRRIAIVNCAGSRDERHLPYCCRVGCMASLKHAWYIKHLIPDAEVFIFADEIRASGKGFEEFYRRVRLLPGVYIVKGRASEVRGNPDGTVSVMAYDPALGHGISINTDLVVLEVGIVASRSTESVRNILKLGVVAQGGFLLELHPKLNPIETAVDGIYICGAVAGPKDIPETVAQASAAASKVVSLLSRGYIETQPYTARVNSELCSGCRICVTACEYGAIRIVEKGGRSVASVDEALCKGCGACVGSCPSRAIEIPNLGLDQIEAMIAEIVR